METPSSPPRITVDGNEAVAMVAHRLSEVIAIYPITPASTMAELCDEWSAAGKANLWGDVPTVIEMQSEGGAAGVAHGGVMGGALCTSFTASQGLLLMLPNLYKLAGELTPFVLHVAARTIATHALSIFGDHSDVMSCRQTGAAMLCAGSVQEAHDFSAISHAATLETRLPFLHFFDGFRTSHEVNQLTPLPDDALRALVSAEAIEAHRKRALSPDHPAIRGTAQNPDAFFQAREAANLYYDRAPELIERVMDRFRDTTGRAYKLFDYMGDLSADTVLVMMGSGAEAAEEAVEWMCARGEKVGLLRVRLYRPWDSSRFLAALPRSVKSVVVLDRTKEPGAPGDPLFLDVVTTLAQSGDARSATKVTAGRYGLSSKEFTPAMVVAALRNGASPSPKQAFTLGIVDDVTHRSLNHDPLDVEPADVVRAMFFGLGSDGTVGSNKNTVKLVGENTPLYAQGYFVYDSKKSGSVTISHLRFSPRPIHATYLVEKASFIACSQPTLLDKLDVLERAAEGATFLLNAPHGPGEILAKIPRETAEQIRDRKIRFFVVNADKVAADAGLKGHVSTVMQACFFHLSRVLGDLPVRDLIAATLQKAYGKRGPEIVARNLDAFDRATDALHEVARSDVLPDRRRPPPVPAAAPPFLQRVTAMLLAGKGDLLPVSAFPVDGTWPIGTSQWEKRTIARQVPIWQQDLCIQCNKCALVCPHAAIRAKVYSPDKLADAPEGFLHQKWKGAPFEGQAYTIQLAPEDCTGCTLCAVVCPAKDKTNPRRKALVMEPIAPHLERERASFSFFETIPEVDRTAVHLDVKGGQLFLPLMEFSGACSGCGETPYIKLLTQLFGDRTLIANATGCSSIYGGNLPTTPYRANAEGRGPAWANSLFEDNAEFGLGLRLAVDARASRARSLLPTFARDLGDTLVTALLTGDQSNEKGLAEQRARVRALRDKLGTSSDPRAAELALLADDLVKRSVWLVGGDGWAYDIGYGGLDHVLSLSYDVNILVLDTEVYSNTGGQQSKATPTGAAAKFAAAGKAGGKKDLGLMAMAYGHVYVASVAHLAKDAHTMKAFVEAESYPGPSLIIAHSPCIAHGYDLSLSGQQQRLAVESGIWPVYRFDPRRIAEGEPPLKFESGPIKANVSEYMANEGRFRAVRLKDPARYAELVQRATVGARNRRALYEQVAAIQFPKSAEGDASRGAS